MTMRWLANVPFHFGYGSIATGRFQPALRATKAMRTQGPIATAGSGESRAELQAFCLHPASRGMGPGSRPGRQRICGELLKRVAVVEGHHHKNPCRPCESRDP